MSKTHKFFSTIALLAILLIATQTPNAFLAAQTPKAVMAQSAPDCGTEPVTLLPKSSQGNTRT